MSKYPVISLFSGLGGIDIGLENAGYDIRVCVEKETDRANTLRLNKSGWNVIEEDICKVKTADILEAADLEVNESFMVAGGPPCQPFSKSAFWVQGRTGNISNDPRTRLLDEFHRVVMDARPFVYLLENVCGLGYKTSKPSLDGFLEKMRKIGYNSVYAILNAADYGVPQKRKRLLIIGSRESCELSFPKATHCKPNNNDVFEKDPWVTAGQAISDLDDGVIHDWEKVGGKYGHLLEQIPPGDNYLYLTEKRGHPDPKFKWRSRFWTFLLKLSPNLPSWTIQANPAKYQGPYHWNNRPLRLDELKVLQTIPLEWEIYGSQKEKRAQIGNACPPQLIKHIGGHIIKSYELSQ